MRWALSWLLYGLGDLAHRWNDNDRRFTDAGYRLYQWLILASDTVQGDGPNGPWGAASGMEAPSGGETHASAYCCTVANCFLCKRDAGGSTEGDSPTGSAGTPK